MEQKNVNSLDNIIDFREFLFKIINNWYYFLLSILFALLVAFGYTRYSHEFYKVYTKVHIHKDNSNTSAADVLYNSLNDNKESSLIDEISMFTSYPLVFETVSDLRFDVSYFLEGNIKTSESFSPPIKVICDKKITQKNPNISFNIDVLDEHTYNLYCKKLAVDNVYSFGDEIQLGSYKFIVERNHEERWGEFPTTIVRFRNLKQIAKEYQSKIQFDKLEKESNIVTIFILEEDQDKGVTFLNALVENFIDNQIEVKKKSSLNTVEFIQDEIQSIEDSLSLIEIKLQDYKNSHQIPYKS